MSLDKIRTWMKTQGRVDVTVDRTPRELAVIDRICRIAMNLDGTVAFQGAKAGKGGEQHDLSFGRKSEKRKTPIPFAGILLHPNGGPWMRRRDMQEPETVRLCLRLTPEGVRRSPWSAKLSDDDGLKPEEGWRYIDIAPSLEISGDELLDLLEDAYFEASGI